MRAMELKLKVIARRDTYSIGKLYIDGIYFCDTLEDTVRDINHNGKFDNNLVGSKYMINGLINSIFTGIKDTNPNTTAIKAIQIVNSHVLLLLFLFIIF